MGQTIVITHHMADLDALASLIGAAKLYPGSRALRGRVVSPPVHRYLALHKDQLPLVPYASIDPAQVERVVVVDVRDRRRLEEYHPMLDAAREVIIFDHHPPCDDDLDGAEVVVEPTGACATLIVERLRDAGATLTSAEATLLLLGIHADTGKLCFDSTTARDVDAVAWLLRQGANLRVAHRYLDDELSLEQRKLLVTMMAQVEEISVDAVEIAITTASSHGFVNGASSVVHHVMQLGGHDAIFGVIHFVKNKRVQVVGRSRVPYVDIGALLSALDGGGHAGAGAATIKGATLEEVVDKLTALLRTARLRPTRVDALMSSPAQTIQADATMTQLEAMLDRQRIRGVPVLRDGALCGVISLRDLDKARQQDDGMRLPVSSFMQPHVTTIAPDEPLEDALAMMTEHDIGRLPVVHEGRLLGVLSRTDLLRRLYAAP